MRDVIEFLASPKQRQSFSLEDSDFFSPNHINDDKQQQMVEMNDVIIILRYRVWIFRILFEQNMLCLTHVWHYCYMASSNRTLPMVSSQWHSAHILFRHSSHVTSSDRVHRKFFYGRSGSSVDYNNSNAMQPYMCYLRLLVLFQFAFSILLIIQLVLSFVYLMAFHS